MEKNNYQCGKCGKKLCIKSTDVIRCTECGYRILFKLRTTKPVTYIAR